MTVPVEQAPANYVPAAAVIRRVRALSGFIGFKGCVGGLLSSLSKPAAQRSGRGRILAILRGLGAGGICGVAVKCIDTTRNTDRVGSWPGPF